MEEEFDPAFRDINDRGYYGFTVYVNSNEMAEPVTAVFHYGDGQTMENTYSVRDYIIAYEEVQDQFDAQTTALVHAVADYGHYVQPVLAQSNSWTIGVDYKEMDKYYTSSYDYSAVEAAVAGYEIIRDTGERVSNIVIMGSGEPLDNYDNVLRFIRLITHEKGQNISQRNITLSTCGIVPGIRRLAEEGIPLTLALSLHAPNDRVREGLMPIAKVYKLDEILDACHYYFEKTGRRVTFEYSLVRGVNDNTAEAAELAALIGRQHGHVNLIPVNPIRERDFVQPDRRAVEAFRAPDAEEVVTVRREMGRDINGACGQLRKSYMDHDATAERNV